MAPMADPQAICAVEVGLLRKKPCGSPAVTQCSNCEQPLCAVHALPELTETGKRSGKFLCKECDAALKEQAKSLAAVAKSLEVKKKAELDKSVMAGMNTPAAKKPAAPAPVAAAAPAAVGKPAEPEQKKEEKKDDFGAIEFTPSKKEE